MTKVNWGTTSGATAGYEFRYSTSAVCLLVGSGCDFDGRDQDWTDFGTGSGSTTLVFSSGTDNTAPAGITLTAGTTYYFQVRGRDADEKYGLASLPSNGITHSFVVAPVPAKLKNVQATPGNAQVTLSWAPADSVDLVTSYDYRQNSGGDWGEDQNFTSSNNTYAVAGLTPGTEHSFQVRARNTEGEGKWSETVSATPTGPPAAPDLRARSVTSGTEVRLYWPNPNDASIEKYQIRRQQSGAFSIWSDIFVDTNNDGANDFDLDADPVEYTVTELSSDTEYTFEVRASSIGGDGKAGSATVTTSTSVTAPAEIVGLTHAVTGVTGGTDGTVTFTWTTPSDTTITGYQYRHRCSTTASGCDDVFTTEGWQGITTSDSTTTSHSMDIPGTAVIVYFQLRAVNATDALEGPATPAITIERSNTPGATIPPPPIPGNLTLVATANSVILSWDEPSNTTNIEWQRQQSTDGGDFGAWEFVTVSATSGRYSLEETDLAAGTTYAYRVRAVDNQGTTTEDDARDDDVSGDERVTGTVTVGTNPPESLTVAAVANDAETDVREDQTQLTLSWTAPSGVTGITGYQYRVRASGDGDDDWSGWTAAGTATPYVVEDLGAGITYEFQVRAELGSGFSTESTSAYGTTADPPKKPSQPTGLRATPGDEQVTLTWNDPDESSISGYLYLQSTDGGTSYNEIRADEIPPGQAATTTEYTVTGLQNDTTYTFQIKADNAAGPSEASESVTVTPRKKRPRPQLPPAAVTGLRAETVEEGYLLTWDALQDTSITIFQYRYDPAASWSDWIDIPDSDLGTTSYTVVAADLGLDVNTEYRFQVRAVNTVGLGPDGEATPFASSLNTAPDFGAATTTRSVEENSPAGTAVGSPVSATDANDDALIYTMSGTDAALFTIDPTTGQIAVGESVTLDFEAGTSYEVTVTVEDISAATASIQVTIVIVNVLELPGQPDAPVLESADPSALEVSWTAPSNTGPPISGYDLQYRTQGADAWMDYGTTVTETTATIDGLTSNTAYEVRVRAINDEGSGEWSEAGVGTTVIVQLSVRFGAAAYSVDEGSSVTVTVLLSPAADRDVVVPIVTTSAARSAAGTPASVSFAHGATSASFDVQALQDDDDKEDESLTLGLGTLPEAVETGSPSSTTITLVDDDKAASARMDLLNVEILGRQSLRVMDDVNAAISSRLRGMAGVTTAQRAQLGGQSNWTDALAAGGRSFQQGLDPRRLLGQSEFALPLQDRTGSGLTIWGSGSYNDLGRAGDDALGWDGNLTGGLVGLDTSLGASLLAGVSMSWSEGDFDYDDEADATAGRYVSSLTTVHPYLGLNTESGFLLWGTAGYGNGDVDIADGNRAMQSSGVSLRAFSVGTGHTLASNRTGSFRLNFMGEGTVAGIDVEGGGLISQATADVSRVRLALEAAVSRAAGANGSFNSALEVGGRRDGGFADDDIGVEVGGGLAYINHAVGLTLETRGRVLVAGDIDDWGVRGLIRLDPGGDGQGLAFQLEPGRGVSDSGVQRMWNEGLQDVGAYGANAGAPLTAEMGYGVRRYGGVLTPYTAISVGQVQAYRVGSRFELGQHLQLGVEGGRSIGAFGIADDALLLHGSWKIGNGLSASATGTDNPYLHQRTR